MNEKNQDIIKFEKDIKETKGTIFLFFILYFFILAVIFGFEGGNYKAVLSSPVYLPYIMGTIFMCIISVVPRFIKIINLKKKIIELNVQTKKSQL
ncbi:hypothetical protein [Alkaliphilus peptidifermentans]|uniref:Uncharacterized protein n=1 Tax=Alkaliphilus peptidifermentans DSM 18978 TaxID=1120976 RepID=A0A1G5KRK1_9FIRM|nr:hypothetical protein [Alkaliphilus peptidifermentans]SCZ02984.1 hypothetical protein SAMN03080606_03696 [Alkaliphilus peptidifermentans DSM 18978]